MTGHDLPKQPVTVGRNTHFDIKKLAKASLLKAAKEGKVSQF